MTLQDVWSGASIGMRVSQQDWHQVTPLSDGGTLCVLADGMGGEIHGDIASGLAGAIFTKSFLEQGSGADASAALPERLMVAADSANRAVSDRIARDRDLQGMGTTMLAVHLRRNMLHWLSIGDSRLLLVMGRDVQRLNADHSYGAWLDQEVAGGRMSPDDATAHPARHALISCIDGGAVEMVELTEKPVTLAAGSTLLVASDGIDTLTYTAIAAIVNRSPGQAETIGRALLEAVEAADNPVQDNCSLVVLC